MWSGKTYFIEREVNMKRKKGKKGTKRDMKGKTISPDVSKVTKGCSIYVLKTVRKKKRIKLEDVLMFLDSFNCFFTAWGETVRSTVIQSLPKRIEGEVHCPIHQVIISTRLTHKIIVCLLKFVFHSSTQSICTKI